MIFEFGHFDWLSQLYSEWRKISKLVNLKISAQVRICDLGQNLKMTKTSYFFQFIKKTLVNHAYIWIWSFWVTFTALQWMKTNFKISQFSRFPLRSKYPIQVKIWKWLTLLNSVSFIQKTLVDEVYIRTWSFSLIFTILQWMKKNSKISQFSRFLLRYKTFTALQWMKTNFKISQFSRFPLRSKYPIQVKIWKWLTLLKSFPFIKKTYLNHLYIRIWSFWVTFTALQWMKENFKISQFEDFC